MMEGPKIAEALRRQRGGDQRSLRPETTGRESASNQKPGRKEEDLGLRCGEANPNPGTGLWGTSGQRPYADSQRQPRSQVGRGRKPGKKEPEEPKKSLDNQKEVLTKKQGQREPSPQAPRKGIHPPGPSSGNPPPCTPPAPRRVVLERPRRDTNGGRGTEVTVTSEQQAKAERAKR